MSMTADLHDPQNAENRQLDSVRNNALAFKNGESSVTLFCLPHIAEATAKAFNRAVQVKADAKGALAYATPAGIFHITTFHGPYTVWQAQHDEVTGDGDPAWMFADAASLEALQDAIDDQVAEHLEGAA